MRALICIMLAAASGFGQADPPAIAGPVLGLVFDSDSGTVRWLPGIPGSATLGGPVDNGPALRQAAVSSEGQYAIGTETATGNTVLISAAGRQVLAGIGPDAGLMAVSPHGTAAVVYSPQAQTALVLAGMPANPRVAWQVALDGPPLLLAVSDDAGSMLAGVRAGRGAETVYSCRAGQAPQGVLNSHSLAALAFMPGSLDSLAAETNAITYLPNGGTPRPLAGEAQGIAKVAAVAGSADGSKLLIAMRSGRVAVWDIGTAVQTVVSCGCTPALAERLRGNAVFRLNETGGGPLWLVDAGGAAPHVFFVAAAPGGSQ